MSERRRTQQERVEESTRLLMRATEELIADVGYEAATAAEIGRRAGFSRSMVRARFGSKEQLIETMLRSAYEAPLEALLSESTNGMESLLARVEALGQAVEQKPHLMRLIFTVEFQAVGRRSASSEPLSNWAMRLQKDAIRCIRSGQLDGSISPGLDAEDVAHSIAVVGFGSAFLWSVDPTDDFRRHFDLWRTHILRALAPLDRNA